MRDVWSDRSRVQYYLDFEKALTITQAYLGVIPREAAEDISLHCNVDEIDFAKLKTATKHIGYSFLVGLFHSLLHAGLARRTALAILHKRRDSHRGM
jgi:adenylosuccinate lyase